MNGTPTFNGASTSNITNPFANYPSTSYDPSPIGSPQTFLSNRNLKPTIRNDPLTSFRDSTSSLRASSRLSSIRQPPKQLRNSDEPILPLTGISSTQAFYTTFPSRMRLGISSILQPNYSNPQQKNSGVIEDLNGTGTGYRRLRTVINYAEMEGLEDSEDESNDIDGNKRKLNENQSRYGQISHDSGENTPGPEGNQWGNGKSYLGSQLPGNLISVQRANLTRHVISSEDDLEEQAEQEAIMVPIQLDLDYETFKLRDSFVWNIKEKLITPTSFAIILCDDLDMPHKPYAEQIAAQITEQIGQHLYIAQIALRNQQEELDSVEKDLRVILNLDVQIGQIHLVDRIEWDLSSALTPEPFTALLISELSLPTCSAPIINHALYKEILKHKKNCLEIGLLNQDEINLTPISFHGNSKKMKGAPILLGIWREWNEIPSFGPRIEILTLDELDKIELEKERILQKVKRDALANANSRTARRR